MRKSRQAFLDRLDQFISGAILDIREELDIVGNRALSLDPFRIFRFDVFKKNGLLVDLAADWVGAFDLAP